MSNYQLEFFDIIILFFSKKTDNDNNNFFQQIFLVLVEKKSTRKFRSRYQQSGNIIVKYYVFGANIPTIYSHFCQHQKRH